MICRKWPSAPVNPVESMTVHCHGVNAASDPTLANKPNAAATVTFGGALTGLSDAGQAATAKTVGAQLDLSV